jgi:hypothetical protein
MPYEDFETDVILGMSEDWNLAKLQKQLRQAGDADRLDREWEKFTNGLDDARPAGSLRDHSQEHRPTHNRYRRSSLMTMTPEDRIDELWHKLVLAPHERELKAALDGLQSALQEHRDYLESVAADRLLSLLLAIRSA